MKKITMLLILLVVLWVSKVEIYARCSIVRYVITGSVKSMGMQVNGTTSVMSLDSAKNNYPVGDAQILIFFNDEKLAYTNLYYSNSMSFRKIYPNLPRTQQNGNYEIMLDYRPYELPPSGWCMFMFWNFGEGACGHKNYPLSIEVVILKQGFSPIRKIFLQKDFKMFDVSEDKLIQLPDIVIDADWD